MLKKKKIYVLRDEELRVEVIQLHHNIPMAGHCYEMLWILTIFLFFYLISLILY